MLSSTFPIVSLIQVQSNVLPGTISCFNFVITLNSFSFPKIEIASSKGRVAQTTNVIMGGTVTNDATDEWLVLDKKVF